jgi:hypothetical protein
LTTLKEEPAFVPECLVDGLFLLRPPQSGALRSPGVDLAAYVHRGPAATGPQYSAEQYNADGFDQALSVDLQILKVPFQNREDYTT